MAPADISARFDSLSLRERLLVTIAIVVMVHQLWDIGWWQPHNREVNSLTSRLIGLSDDLKLSEKEFSALTQRLGQDPNLSLRQNVSLLERQLGEIEHEVSGLAGDLVSPTRMAEMLEDLLTRESELTLVTLESRGTTPMLRFGDQPVAGRHRYQLYRHGFAIEFEGGYLATLRYLDALDRLPWRFHWDRLEYEVKDYPRSRVRLELHTLSLSEGWIGV